MKAYKIAVPVADVIHGEHQTITRQEIHELIQDKAVNELKYPDMYPKRNIYDEKYIYISLKDGIQRNSRDAIFNRCLFQEISPFDFLKLTPEDVITEPVQIFNRADFGEKTNINKQALLEAFTAGWDAAHNNRFSIGVNFDKWYHEKAGNK